MAPPSSRRSGFSRRAQYGTFIGYVAGIVGAIVGAVLLLISLNDPSSFSGLRTAAADAVEPAARLSASTRTGSQGFFGTIRGYFAAGAQNARLKREMEIARVRLAEADAVADENRRLKALLGLMSGNPKPIASARLIASTPSSTRRFAMLDAGRADGVLPGMPVRSPLGLVGRVLEAGRSSARVLLITDTESVVPVRRAKDGVAAFAQGKGDGTLQLRLINLGINPLKVGDVFVTSGSGGLYWPNTAVAVVTYVTRDGAIARILSDPAMAEFVAVDPAWAKPEGENPGASAGTSALSAATAPAP